MATTTIPQLPVATSLDGREYFELAVPASADPVTSYVSKRAATALLSTAQFNLDSISTTWGAILYRGEDDWVALDPGAANTFLKSNGPDANPEWAAEPSMGTVTSVAMTVPSFLSVAGSPITTSGTLALSLATQSANTFFSGPDMGSAAAPTFRSIVNADIASAGAALSRVDDTNVTLTLGGAPTTALVNAASLTLGWTGQLAVPRGGTGAASFTEYAVLCGGTTSTGALQSIAGVGTTGQALLSNGAGALPTFQTLSSAVGSALTRVDDTNVTLTLGGSPTTALLAATSLTLGWSGQLGVSRGGTGLASGTSGGILGYTASGTLASSVELTANQIVLGGGAGTTPIPLGSLGTTTTVLHGNAAGAPTFGAVSLTADVTGTLPAGNGGTGVTSLGTLSRTDDTNVTLTLGGTPANSLIQNVSITAGWTGTLAPDRGGTGIANNAASTITISGAFALTATLTNTTSVTFPTIGTLATLAGSETLSNKTLTAPTINGGTGIGLGKVAGANGGYITGRYYLVTGGNISTGAQSADIVSFIPFVCSETHTFDRIAIEVTTTGTATLARLAIYTSVDGAPSALVVDGSTVSVAGTGPATVTISQSLSPGVYWLAVVFDGTVTISTVAQPLTVGFFTGVSNLTGAAVDPNFQAAMTFGAFPSTAFTGAMGSLAPTTGTPALIALRA